MKNGFAIAASRANKIVVIGKIAFGVFVRFRADGTSYRIRQFATPLPNGLAVRTEENRERNFFAFGLGGSACLGFRRLGRNHLIAPGTFHRLVGGERPAHIASTNPRARRAIGLHQQCLPHERGGFHFPIETLFAFRTSHIAPKTNARRFLRDEIIEKERNLLAAIQTRANRGFDPERVDDVGVGVATARALGLVLFEQGLAHRFAAPRDVPLRESVERGAQCVNVHRFDFALDDEPRDGIEVNARDLTSQTQGFDNSRAAAHKRIEDKSAVRVRVICVVAIKFRHNVGASGFETTKQNRAEHARGAAREPLVHLVDGLECVALRHR